MIPFFSTPDAYLDLSWLQVCNFIDFEAPNLPGRPATSGISSPKSARNACHKRLPRAATLNLALLPQIARLKIDGRRLLPQRGFQLIRRALVANGVLDPCCKFFIHSF